MLDNDSVADLLKNLDKNLLAQLLDALVKNDMLESDFVQRENVKT